MYPGFAQIKAIERRGKTHLCVIPLDSGNYLPLDSETTVSYLFGKIGTILVLLTINQTFSHVLFLSPLHVTRMRPKTHVEIKQITNQCL